MRVIEKGDMVSFDADLVGPYGYCSDISRSWVCDAQPSNEQRRLCMTAMEQLEHNREMVKPGLSFRGVDRERLEDARRVRRQPLWRDRAQRRPVDEYPAIYFPQDYEANGYDGHFEPGILVCVEALIGSEGGRECVKLEQQVLVTETGYEQLDTYRMDETWH